MNQSNYFTMEESEQFAFYRVPKVLMTNSRYNAVTAEAKLLYGLLLDRMSLSTKNGWCDDNGLIFIYFTIREAMACLNCGHDKAGNLFCELEKVNLLERRRQGQGKPSILYVKKFISDIEKTDIKKSAKPLSKKLNFSSQDIVKSATNNTDMNDTDFSDTDLSINRDEIDMDEMVKENIEYDILVERCPADKERIDELVCLMVDTLSSTKNTIQISGNDFPKEIVKSRFMKLTCEHIEYVLDMLKKNPSDIRNIRAYLLSSLYNAGATIDNYYTALVNHDFNGHSA